MSGCWPGRLPTPLPVTPPPSPPLSASICNPAFPAREPPFSCKNAKEALIRCLSLLSFGYLILINPSKHNLQLSTQKITVCGHSVRTRQTHTHPLLRTRRALQREFRAKNCQHTTASLSPHIPSSHTAPPARVFLDGEGFFRRQNRATGSVVVIISRRGKGRREERR